MPKVNRRSIQSKRKQRRLQKLQKRKADSFKIPAFNDSELVDGGGSHCYTVKEKHCTAGSSSGISSVCMQNPSSEGSTTSGLTFGSSVPSPPLSSTTSSCHAAQSSPRHSGVLAHMEMTLSTNQMLDKVNLLPVLERCDKLAEIASRKAQETIRYKNLSTRQHHELQTIEEESSRKIAAVRHFWRDKIFRETSRSGKIVKMACGEQRDKQVVSIRPHA